MLLVQLTALVVWLAQYVSAADSITVEGFYSGDVVDAKIDSLDPSLTNTDIMFLDTQPFIKSGLDFKSESSEILCLDQPFNQLLTAARSWLPDNDFHYILKDSKDSLLYYIKDRSVPIHPLPNCVDQ